MELLNLHDFIENAINEFSFEEFSKDRCLPQAFKDYVSQTIDGSKYLFLDTTTIVKTDLFIYCPNQWFYIAAYYCKLYPLLKKYKDEVYALIPSDIPSGDYKGLFTELYGNPEKAKELFKDALIEESKKNLLVSFVSDYSWWRGGKGIERNDFFYSPILSAAKLVNQSQSYVAEICKFLIENPAALDILQKEIAGVQTNLSSSVIVEESILAVFMGKCLQRFLEYDKNLSKVRFKINQNTIGFKGCQIGKKKTDFEAVTDPRRLDDCDRNIAWNVDDVEYLFLKEQSFNSLNVFAENFNKAYQGKFEIRVNGNIYQLIEYTIQHEITKPVTSDLPLQQIFYGAPGTGKSHTVDDVCKKYTHFRTTFHPDSDYSTFVGCYKPTMGKAMPIYGFDSVGHTVKVQDPVGSVVTKKDITYEFTPQAFTNAYIKAWEDLSKPVFLVIEEINRGNCAQIFGDLFQLLDRKDNGYSSYEIEPNTDLGNYIKGQGLNIEGVKDSDGKDISDKLMAGELMTLPPNLHIWATMNTSDQSLFPIDSAFKRRWDWKYMPINPNAKSGWTIKVNGMSYSWSSFLEKINVEIEDTTSSEDKQLGFFFCKADGTDNNDNNGKISAEKFVSKVLFYIYNDVFKDYGFEREFFKGEGNKIITFRSFFKVNGDINELRVAELLDNLKVEHGVYTTDTAVDDDDDAEDEDGNKLSSPTAGRDYTKYSINGVGRYAKNKLAAECVEKYIELHPTESAEEVLNKWKALNVRVSHFIESKEEYDARNDNSKWRSREIKCGDTFIYVAIDGYGSNGMATVLKNAVNQKDWGIIIEEA